MKKLEYTSLKKLGLSEKSLYVYSNMDIQVLQESNGDICLYLGSVCESNYMCSYRQDEIKSLNEFFESQI